MTLLAMQLSSLRGAGLKRILVVSGYRGRQIRPIGRIARIRNSRWRQSSIVVSLLMARKWFSDGKPVIVSYGDIFYPVDFVKRLLRHHGEIVVAYDTDWKTLWCERFADPLVDAERFRVSDDGMIKEIGGRSESLDDIQGQYIGLIKITPEGWKKVKRHVAMASEATVQQMDMTTLLGRMIREEICAVHGVPCSGVWGEVDWPSDMDMYEKKWGDLLRRRFSRRLP